MATKPSSTSSAAVRGAALHPAARTRKKSGSHDCQFDNMPAQDIVICESRKWTLCGRFPMLIEPLLAQAQGQPDEIAVLDDHGPCSYQKLATMAGGMARLIAAQTDRPVVGLMLPSSAMYA